MPVKDISDLQVVQAYLDSKANGQKKWPYELLAERTGEPEKVCYRACERAANKGYIEYGVSLRAGWITDAGKSLMVRSGVV